MGRIIDYLSVAANRDRVRTALAIFVIVGGVIMNAILLVAIIHK